MFQRFKPTYFFIFLILFLNMAFVCYIPVSADEKHVVKIGCYENEIFQEGADGEKPIFGYAYEYYRKLSEYTGWEYEYVYGTFSEVYQKLVNGEIDLLAGLAKADDRMDIIAYPNEPMGNEKYNLIKHSYDDEITSNPLSFEGKTIGILDSAMVSALDEYMDSYTVNVEVVLYDDYSALYDDFDNEIIDIAAVEGSGAYGRPNSEVVCSFGSADYYLCVNINRPDILEELNNAQALIAVEEPFYLKNLESKYYSGSVSSLDFSDAEKEWIDNNIELDIGYIEDFLPYCGTDDNGNVTGIIKDIIPELFDDLNISDIAINYHGYKSYNEMLEDLKNSNIDIAFPVDGSLYNYEENGIYQTNPLMSVNNELVYRAGLDNASKGKSIALNINNGLQYYYAVVAMPGAEYLFYDSIDECIEAVQKGEADGTILNGLRAYNILRNSKYDGLSVMQLSMENDICLGIDIGNTGLLKLMNRGISVMDKEYALKMASYYVDDLYSYTFEDFFEDNYTIVILSVVAVFLIIIIIFIYSFYKKINEEKSQRYAIQNIFDQMIMSFAKIIDKKDEYTSGHSVRVAEYSRKLARKIGYTKAMAQKVYNIALLHDIGKIIVPNQILNKPEELNDREYTLVKEHVALGKEILQEIDSIPEIALGAGYHHEKYDGTGYPEGLKGDDIPEIAQIISIADAFDAMYSTRPYRKQMELEYCLNEIRKGEGTQFNPQIAEAFIELVHDGWLDQDDDYKDVLWW